MLGKDVRTLKEINYVLVDQFMNMLNVVRCTPYIEPSIHDKVKEKLGIELYEEFMKEGKGA